MISDDELSQLPEDPTLAFVEFEKILRAHVDKQELQAFRLSEEGVMVPYALSVSSFKSGRQAKSSKRNLVIFRRWRRFQLPVRRRYAL